MGNRLRHLWPFGHTARVGSVNNIGVWQAGQGSLVSSASGVAFGTPPCKLVMIPSASSASSGTPSAWTMQRKTNGISVSENRLSVSTPLNSID